MIHAKAVRRVVWGVAGALSLIFLLVVGGLLFARLTMPTQPVGPRGVVDDRLHPCGDTPNCVSSSDSRDPHLVTAVPYTASAEEALERSVYALESIPRTTIVERSGSYIRAQARSAVFRYVDDVEVYVDANGGSIGFRSASRVGYSDFGRNRARYEAYRDVYTALEASR